MISAEPDPEPSSVPDPDCPEPEPQVDLDDVEHRVSRVQVILSQNLMCIWLIQSNRLTQI